jgi:hypothetical protein
VLAAVVAPNSVVDCFRAIRRVDHHRLTAQYFFDRFQKLSQPLQVEPRRQVRGVVQRPVVGDGQLCKREMLG